LYANPAIDPTGSFLPGIKYPKNGIPLPEKYPIVIPDTGMKIMQA
jgi:hypothetical protein